MAKIPWTSQYFPVFLFSFSEKQFAKLRNSAKNKTLRKLGKGRDVFFFELFFGARGLGGEGSGSELLGGWGCCQVVFSSFSSSSSSYARATRARATRAWTKLWFADLDSSSPAAFCFLVLIKRTTSYCFLSRIGRADDDLSFFWFCFGFFTRAAYRWWKLKSSFGVC